MATRYGKPKQRIPRSIRRAVRERDDYTCRKCGERTGRLHSHHVVAEKDGGQATVKNLVTVCLGCHIEIHNLEHVKVNPLYAQRRAWAKFLQRE